MIVDYESAWNDLLALLVERDGWGSKTLLVEAVKLTEKHRVPENSVERVIRIFGADTVAEVIQGSRPSSRGGEPTDVSDRTPTNEVPGGHDGSQHQHHPAHV